MKPTYSQLRSKEVGRTWEKNATQHRPLQPQYIKNTVEKFIANKVQLQIETFIKTPSNNIVVEGEEGKKSKANVQLFPK